jgi:hypothetical protein
MNSLPTTCSNAAKRNNIDGAEAVKLNALGCSSSLQDYAYNHFLLVIACKILA